jgi:2-phospho-L-lactate guanylyltransferase
VVLVPVKSFDLAKGRLAQSLGADERRRLARNLAANVVRAAGPLPTFVVCDHRDVAAWAVSTGTGVLWVTTPGLNPALTRAVETAAADGYRRAIICHADLPLAHDLTWLTDHRPTADVIIVPDRHGTGTNVMSIPIGPHRPFTLHYGPGSAEQHRREAERVGWTAGLATDERLGWDLDTPEDLLALELADGTVLRPADDTLENRAPIAQEPNRRTA